MDDKQKKSSFELGRDPKPYIRTRKLHQLPKDTRIHIRNDSEIRDVHYNPKEFRKNNRNRVSESTSCSKQPISKGRNDSIWATWLILGITFVSIAYIIGRATA